MEKENKLPAADLRKVAAENLSPVEPRSTATRSVDVQSYSPSLQEAEKVRSQFEDKEAKLTALTKQVIKEEMTVAELAAALNSAGGLGEQERALKFHEWEQKKESLRQTNEKLQVGMDERLRLVEQYKFLKTCDAGLRQLARQESEKRRKGQSLPV